MAQAKQIRLTIPVSPEVHEVFTRMAKASNISLGRAMGEWLQDTLEGAQFVALKMEDARNSPRTVLRELQAMSSGIREDVDGLLESFRASTSAVVPPPSNTGGNEKKREAARGGKS